MHLWIKKLNLDIFTHAYQANSPLGSYHYAKQLEITRPPLKQRFFKNLLYSSDRWSRDMNTSPQGRQNQSIERGQFFLKNQFFYFYLKVKDFPSVFVCKDNEIKSSSYLDCSLFAYCQLSTIMDYYPNYFTVVDPAVIMKSTLAAAYLRPLLLRWAHSIFSQNN